MESVSAPSQTSRTRVGMVTALVTLAMMAGTMLPVALGALGPFVVHELDISAAGLGVLVTVSFAAASMGSLFMGQIADGMNQRFLLLSLFAYTALIIFATSLTPGYTLLLIPFAMAGFGLAAANPITNKLVALNIPPSAQGMSMGIKQSGVPIGILLSGLILPPIAAAMGWQAAIRVATLVPLVALLLVWRAVPSDVSKRGPRKAIRLSLPGGLVRPLMVFAFFMGGGVAATHTFLPLFAHETLGMSKSLAGATLSAVGLTGIFSRIVWTYLSNRAGKVRKALLAVGTAALLSAGSFLLAPSLGAGAVWFGAAVQGASAVAWAPLAMLAVLQNVGYEEMGHASAMVNLGFFAGFIVTPPLFGFLVESTGAYTIGWFLVAAQFITAVVILWVWNSD